MEIAPAHHRSPQLKAHRRAAICEGTINPASRRTRSAAKVRERTDHHVRRGLQSAAAPAVPAAVHAAVSMTNMSDERVPLGPLRDSASPTGFDRSGAYQHAVQALLASFRAVPRT